MADEALRSFTSLLESVPGWIEELERILKSATDRQKDLLFDNQPPDIPDLAPKKKASKSSSLRSKRSRDAALPTPAQLKSETTLLKDQIPHMTESDALRLAQRKRKTASACSGRPSGPSKYRSKGMVVVYYDGDVQKRFENIVRAIGGSRNLLRKGKMSAKVEAISRTGSSSSEEGNTPDGVIGIRKMGYRPARTRQGAMLNKDDGSEAFDKADGLLEKAQTLCERAAHQVLRDGDCALEINNAREHFYTIRSVGDTALPTLEKKAAKAMMRRRRSEEQKKAEAEEECKLDALSTGDSSEETLIPAEDPFCSSTAIEVAIEADDSDNTDDDGHDFNVNAMHLGKYQMRSTRVAAH